MSAVLGAAIDWQPDDYVLFRKCGEITISPDIQNIGFNCLFCTGICLQTDIFLQHLQEQHKEEIFQMYEKQTSSENNSSAEIVLNLNNSLINTNTNYNISNHIDVTEETQALKGNYIIVNSLLTAMEHNLTPPNDLNLVFNLESNSDLLTLTSPNQDLENLITFNPLENFANNTSSNSSSVLASNAKSTFTTPSNVISASVGYFKCLPDDKECEIGDGEDSGIMLVQSPPSCNSDDCVGSFSDCMSFTEDNSSNKSQNSLNEKWPNSSSEYKEQHLETEITNNPDEECTKSAKGKYLKTPAMRKALNNKDLIAYLLEAYRNNEKLWNPKHSGYKYNAHRTIYSELSQPLLNHMKYSLTGEEIFGIINELRGRYRRELKKFEARKGKHKTRLWYFEKMEFLRQTIEEKRKDRNKDKACTAKALDSNACDDLNNRQILSYLVDLYRQYECLWNPMDLEYETCSKTELFDDMSEQLRENINVDMRAEECMNEIQKLRIRYRKELRILHKLKGLYLPKLWCFDEMEFLRPVMEEKITKNLEKNVHHPSNSLSQRHDFLKATEIQFNNLEQQLLFIELYRNCNSLWDVDHPDYRSTTYRRKALNEMLDKVNITLQKEQKYNLQQLEKTIYTLRKDFSQEKHKRLMDSQTDKESGMSCVLYEKLCQFLAINLGPFRCDSCQQILKTYDQYKIHKSKHDGTLPFICTLCGKGFQMPGNLTIHIRRHRRDFPYSCEICSKSFATSTEVNIHMRSHTGERPYVCEWCEKTFKTWSFYDLHRRTHLNQSNFHCPICDKSFYERNRFTDHMNVHLNIRKHQCDQCGKGFTTLGNLKKHLDLHAAVKKYKCQPCGKRFAQFASLQWHRKTQHKQ